MIIELGSSMKPGTIIVEEILIIIGRENRLLVTHMTYFWAILGENWSKTDILFKILQINIFISSVSKAEIIID